jgi:beta-galactosidase
MADEDGANDRPAGHVPPEARTSNRSSGGPFAGSNRPVTGATHAIRSILYAALALASVPAAAQPAASAHSFAVAGAGFVRDGKPYQVISGELHYVRIPRAYWRDRLRKAKAMGLNTITTYAFWNVHEPRPGVYDFTGQNDIAAFIRDAQAEGLDVILRPGPYVCAEWELGGYPAWLLKDRKLVLRSTAAV